MPHRPLLLCLLIAASAATAPALAAGPQAPRGGLPDLLDTPVIPSEFARKGATSSLARHGERLIAVGGRGLILVSDNLGLAWKQVASPVSSDLVSVKFTDARTVWAVGHDAVALRSTDGGASWQKLLDGRSVLALLRTHYAAQSRSGDTAADKLLREVDRSAAQSATPNVLPSPFLDVWFADANEGYLVGAFGLVLRTTDGGQHWEPWIERLDNERRFHLYAVTGEGPERYIAGEQGLLLRLDPVARRFVKVETPYTGTYFGLQVRGERLLAFGLRGNAYLRPSAAAAWHKLETGIDANLVAAVSTADERLLLVSQAGHVLAVSADQRQALVMKTPATGEVLAAVAAGPRSLVLARTSGVGLLDLGPLNQ